MIGSDTLAFAPEVPKDIALDVFDKEERAPETPAAGKKPVSKWRGESMYPKLLQELINTVLAHEAFLFSETERGHLEHLSSLAYGPRYLFIRLALRRRSKLHRLSDLQARYSDELGDDVQSYLEALCSPSSIALLEDDSNGGPCPPQEKHPELYAHDETNVSTEELLGALKGDEIKDLATKLKVAKAKMTRADLIQAMMNGASKQSRLSFPLFKPMPRPALTEVPTTPPSSSRSVPIVIDLVSPPRVVSTSVPRLDQTSRLRELIIGIEKKFVRVSEPMFDLLQRINLVYFRSTEIESNSILLPLILSRSKKRKYPDYPATRSVEVFSSRDHLLAYEQALQLEADIEKALSEGETRVERGEAAYQLFESVYARWQSLVTDIKASGEEGAYARPGLERFEEGHVLTRIVCKGADALAILHRYEDEVSLLRELLSQKRWRKGKRGVWYDRLALVLMQHLSRPTEAMQVVIDALHDDLTHIVTRPRLVRRLTRLEKRLKITDDQRHVSEGELQKCESVTIEGCRVYHTRPKSLTPITSFFNVHGASRSRSPSLARGHSDPSTMVLKGAVGTHSIWRSKDGEEIGVEELALEHYASLGYRGFHSEGRIVRHIFLLLFWSIIFQPVEGAFETSYQIAPLDIGHDSFYFARKAEIDARLQALENGEGVRIARETDEQERKLNTFAIGAAWDLCTKEEYLEIIECFDGKALAQICRVMCEDYTHRSSGVPDLLVWNYSTASVKFVEVKGPGDTLMENQKVWIDVLLGAGIDVEVCHVQEKGAQEVKIKTGKSKTKSLAKNSAATKTKAQTEEREVKSEHEMKAPAVTVAPPPPRPVGAFKPSATSKARSRKVPIYEFIEDDDEGTSKDAASSLKRTRSPSTTPIPSAKRAHTD